MNTVILTGRFVRDPEIRYTNSKKAVASFTLAVQDGKDKAHFVNCVAWEKTAELVDQYFLKGDPIGVIGKLTYRTYEKDGKKHSVTEVNVSSIEFPMRKKQDEYKETEGEPSKTNAFSDLSDDEEFPF